MRRLLAPIPIAVLCLLAGLVGLLAYGLAQTGEDRRIDAAIARDERAPAPALELPALSGGGGPSLADLRGQVVVLNFWASWCGPCKDEAPLLERWHRRLEADDGTVLGVNVQDASGKAREFTRENGLTFPSLRDGPGESMEAFGVARLPETFVIDRQGRIAAASRGVVDARFLRENVEPLLKEPS